MRFVGERRAIAAASLSLFMVILLLNGIIGGGPARAMILGLGLAYLVAFLGVVAGWFWARWYALGLAFSGVSLAAMLGWQQGWDLPEVWVIGGFHGLACLALLGEEAASAFDGRRDWRERLHMDENAVNRLGKAVTRAGASLPYLIVAGLAPRQSLDAGSMALLLAVIGLGATLHLRTWGLLVMAAAAVVAWTSGAGSGPFFMGLPAVPWVGAALLTAAVWPFAAPMIRFTAYPHRRD
jgi:hypothetical protein